MNELKINGFSAIAEDEMTVVNGGEVLTIVATAVATATALYAFGELCGKGLGKLFKKWGWI